MVCQRDPGMGLGVHATVESCTGSWGNDRVERVQVWSQRAGPPWQLCLRKLPGPLTLTSLYSKMHTVRVHMFMVAIIKVLSLETYRIHVYGQRDVGCCDKMTCK